VLSRHMGFTVEVCRVVTSSLCNVPTVPSVGALNCCTSLHALLGRIGWVVPQLCELLCHIGWFVIKIVIARRNAGDRNRHIQ
jgi:hypothetical protein